MSRRKNWWQEEVGLTAGSYGYWVMCVFEFSLCPTRPLHKRTPSKHLLESCRFGKIQKETGRKIGDQGGNVSFFMRFFLCGIHKQRSAEEQLFIRLTSQREHIKTPMELWSTLCFLCLCVWSTHLSGKICVRINQRFAGDKVVCVCVYNLQPNKHFGLLNCQSDLRFYCNSFTSVHYEAKSLFSF